MMGYRLPDVLIKDRQTPGLVISLILVAVCAFGVCRARQLTEEGHGAPRDGCCEPHPEP
jgi:hypothetical protein